MSLNTTAIHFARSGDPNHSGLPHWPVFSSASAATMIFDRECAARDDPGLDARRILLAAE